MTTLETRRLAEVAKYDKKYWHRHTMRPWRQDIVRDWLTVAKDQGYTRYLDVGCGKGETLLIAKTLGLQARGCDVVDHLCSGPDIDLIEGAHNLPYDVDEFDVTSCNDVMEHILEEDVPSVLSAMSRVTKHAVLLGISRHTLKPGKPYHITIKSEEWWLGRIAENMAGRASVVFADRIPKIKQPYLWVSIQ